MKPVFNSPQPIQGAFRADMLSLHFGPFDSGMLVQNTLFAFSQMVSMLFELGVPQNGMTNAYLVAGHAQGNLSVGRLVGPIDVGIAFLTQFGDVCNAVDNTIMFAAAGCCVKSHTRTYTLSGCVVNQIGVNVSAQEAVIHEQMSMVYANLDVK